MKKIRDLWPILLTFLLYLIIGVVSKNFNSETLLLALLVSGVLTIIFYRKQHVTFKQKLQTFQKGSCNKMIIMILTIFLLSGILCSCLKVSGSIDAMIKCCIGIIPANYFLPFLFLISCLFSFAIGTSVGTLGAILPLAYGIAMNTHLNLALVGGCIIGGAMFGDNLSFISDTTIAATQTMRVEMVDKFKANIALAIPALLVTVILLICNNAKSIVFTSQPVDYLLIMPYILIVVLVLFKYPIEKVLILGIVITISVGMVKETMNITQIIPALVQGALSMLPLIFITFISAGINEIIKVPILKTFQKIDFSHHQAPELIIASMVSVVTVVLANNCISILSVGPLAKVISDKCNLSYKRVASLLDVFASGVMGILPYGAQVLMCSQIMHTSIGSIISCNWYSWLILLFGLVSIIFNQRLILKEKKVLEVENF